MSRLQPGAYELILYTHECATNMDPEHGVAISSFDLLLTMSLRLVRVVTQGASGTKGAEVPLEILESGAGGITGAPPAVRETRSSAPLLLSSAELWCRSHYHELPSSLDTLLQFGSLDLSETFFAPVTSFYSHEILFKAREGQDALRVLLARSNAKIALLEGSGDRKLVAQSRPVEGGRAQVLIATKLTVNSAYILVVELSEESGVMDGATAQACAPFGLAIKTWDSGRLCSDGSNLPDVNSWTSAVTIGAEPSPQTITLSRAAGRASLAL